MLNSQARMDAVNNCVSCFELYAPAFELKSSSHIVNGFQELLLTSIAHTVCPCQREATPRGSAAYPRQCSSEIRRATLAEPSGAERAQNAQAKHGPQGTTVSKACSRGTGDKRARAQGEGPRVCDWEHTLVPSL